MTKPKFLFLVVMTVFIVGCSTDFTNNLPPGDFSAIAVESGFNNIIFRWTESIDPENTIVKYNVYIAENIEGSEYQLIAADLTEELVADTEVIKVDGQTFFIDPPQDPMFRFAYAAVNLAHDKQWKGKIVAIDQDGNSNESFFYSSTLTDSIIPSITDFSHKVYRFNSNVRFIIEDNFYDSHTIEFYLNNTLYSTLDVSYTSFIDFKLENLTENTSYEGTIVITDNNGNDSEAYTFTFSTSDETYTGDLNFAFNQEEIDFFGLNNYSNINGNLTIHFVSSDINYNPFNSIESITGNISFSFDLWNSDPIEGFTSLRTVDGNMHLGKINPSDIFNNLETVTGELDLYYSMQGASSNPAFENLVALSDLTLLEGSIFNGFNSLVVLEGRLSIAGTSLDNLDFLSGMTEINNGLQIVGNFNLTNLCGLETVINSNGLIGEYTVTGNAFNPSINDIQIGNCSQ